MTSDHGDPASWIHLARASGHNDDGTYTAVISVRLRVDDEMGLRAANLVPFVDTNDTPDWGPEFAVTNTVAEAVRTADWGTLTPVEAQLWVGSSGSAIPGEQFPGR